MKNAIKLKLLSVALIIPFFSACGGGGSGGTTESTDPSQSFNLTKLKDASTEGTVFQSSLNGTYDGPSGKKNATGNITVKNIGQETVDGVLTYKSRTELSIIVDGNYVGSTGITYIDENGYFVKFTVDDNVTCTPTSQTLLPDTISVGDSGNTESISCSDGKTQKGTWAAESSSPGYIIFTRDDNVYEGAQLVSSTKQSYKINSDGYIVGMDMDISNIRDGVTINLSSSK